MNYRPEGWKNPHRKGSVHKPEDTYARMIYLAYEAGADAMYEAIMKVRPSDSEIRVRIIEALYGAVSIPDFEKWLKERLLLKP